MSLIENFSYVILGCLITGFILRRLLKIQFGQTLLDKPNHRSLHTVPTPRIGGLVFVPVSTLLGLTNQFDKLSNLILIVPFAAAVLFIFTLGIIDDRRGLSALRRLFLQFISASLCWFGILLATQSLGIVNIIWDSFNPWFYITSLLAIVLITWSINLVNFMDGANGLVASISIVGLACLSFLIPDQKVRLSVLALIGSLIAFLYFNLVAKKIFMGDAGSTCLGLTLGTLCIWGVIAQYWEWTFALITFAPLLFDASLTLFRRILKRERFWEGHRSHLYQRLIFECNFSHLRVSVWYSLASATGFFVLYATLASSLLMRYSAAVLVGVTYICTYYILNRWISAKKSVFAKQNRPMRIE
jgi:UDP-N-acetylmuramyl pentapeptide phosphotransferase/UDP-N-acetylglucosamine-1-phosphate transferase